MYRRAQEHFKKADPILYRASRIHKIADVRRSRDVFGDLVHAIINQQLSGKAADTIYKRLIAVVAIDPKSLVRATPSSLRACGLSEAKVKAIQGLAQAVMSGTIDLANIHKHPDDKVMELLTSLRGIGPWTAEMIMMHSLGRVDIFSKGDLGLKKGIMYLYGMKKLPGDRTMDKLAKNWSPYRTYASRVLWRVADLRAHLPPVPRPPRHRR